MNATKEEISLVLQMCAELKIPDERVSDFFNDRLKFIVGLREKQELEAKLRLETKLFLDKISEMYDVSLNDIYEMFVFFFKNYEYSFVIKKVDNYSAGYIYYIDFQINNIQKKFVFYTKFQSLKELAFEMINFTIEQ